MACLRMVFSAWSTVCLCAVSSCRDRRSQCTWNLLHILTSIIWALIQEHLIVAFHYQQREIFGFISQQFWRILQVNFSGCICWLLRFIGVKSLNLLSFHQHSIILILCTGSTNVQYPEKNWHIWKATLRDLGAANYKHRMAFTSTG